MYMLCKKPIVLAGRTFGCGQCLPCRCNKRRIWSTRIMMEARQYADNAFVTLTYADDMLPHDGSVVPKHLQDWLKRLRAKHFARVRFFAVGEYGDDSLRPHYHVALFNYPTCSYGMSRYGLVKNCCYACDTVRDTWRKGNVFVGALEDASASYVCGYVTKKMTSAGDPRLEGRYPEFARMSLKPGIGGDAMWEVSSGYLSYDLEGKPVKGALRVGQQIVPLGRYLVRRLRKWTGQSEDCPQEVLDEIEAELLPMRVDAARSEENPSLAKRVIEANAGKVASFEAKKRVFKSRRVL